MIARKRHSTNRADKLANSAILTGKLDANPLNSARTSMQRHLGNHLMGEISMARDARVQRSCGCGGSCGSCSASSEEPYVQTKLKVGAPNDRFEREADRVADTVMRLPSPGSDVSQAQPSIQRLSGNANRTLSSNSTLPRGEGRALSSQTRAFMEPRFGVDFSQVRLHSGPQALQAADRLNARAFTYGSDIWLGRKAKESDHHLMAHELTHVVQQQGAGSDQVVQRIEVEGTCRDFEPPEGETDTESTEHTRSGEERIREAWRRATTLVNQTVSILDNMRSAMTMDGGPARIMPRYTSILRKTFGDVGGLEGNSSFSQIAGVIRRFRRIQTTLAADAFTIRCVGNDPLCGQYLGAYVRLDTRGTIFVCDRFTDKSLDSRAETIIHELTHAVLGTEHAGIGGATENVTPPPMFYDCRAEGFDISFEDALNNAYTYELLVACLVGSRPTSEIRATRPKRAENHGHTANELGAYVLIPSTGGAGVEVRYTRVLLGHAPGWEFFGAAGLSYLSHGDTAGLGLGVGVRYAWPWVYVQGGAGLEGNAAFSPEHGPSPALNLGVIAEAEAGVDLGVVRLSGGYRLLLPVTGDHRFVPEHIGMGGVSLDF